MSEKPGSARQVRSVRGPLATLLAPRPAGVVLKTPAELAMMREAGRLVGQVHQRLRAAIAPGVTTGELNSLAETLLREAGAQAPFKDYPNAQLGGPVFPSATCISVNEELVHGIPGRRALVAGDIVSVDVGALLKGWHGDSAWTYAVAPISTEAQRLLDVTERALFAGIEQARPGKRTGDVAAAIQSVVEAAGFSVVRDYTSHGIGRQLHEPPSMVNYGKPGRGVPLRAGMTLALEPMVNAGRPETRVLADLWTVVSADGSLTAHFEHTIAITERGAELLTTP